MERTTIQIQESVHDRFLYQFLRTVRKRCKLSPNYIILILDDYCGRLLDKMGIGSFDRMSQKVYQVERLSIGRKRYPMSDAIYFIEPTESSINMLVSDFTSKNIDYDQYGNIHIGFCRPCE